jgi:predicted permease
MPARATVKAIAFLLNGAVFLVGIARLQSRLAPPDYIYVGLLFAAPIVSWLALVLSYRKRVDPEVAATAKAATVVLNVLLLGFVAWLTARLDSDTRADEALWLVLLFATPPANALAILRSLPGRETGDSAIT